MPLTGGQPPCFGRSCSWFPFLAFFAFFTTPRRSAVGQQGAYLGARGHVPCRWCGMSRLLEMVFVRSGCAFVLGCIGSLIGLVAWAGFTAQHHYPRSPSPIVWEAVGGAFGFVLGACIGNRRLKGRPEYLVL